MSSPSTSPLHPTGIDAQLGACASVVTGAQRSPAQPAGHFCVVGVPQLPVPLQTAADIAESSAQKPGAHVVSLPGNEQSACPAQLPAHGPVMPHEPWGGTPMTAMHVPTLPGAAQV